MDDKRKLKALRDRINELKAGEKGKVKRNTLKDRFVNDILICRKKLCGIESSRRRSKRS